MTDAPTRQAVMTIEEFVRRYEQDGPFELVEGEIIPMSPTILRHNDLAKLLYDAILLFNHGKDLGTVRFEAPFILPDTYSPDWVKGSRVPDVMFITAARWQAYIDATPDAQDKPIMIVPDLVVEIVSPTDRFSDVERKVLRYLDDGVRLVWLVDAQNQLVRVVDAARESTLTGDATLDGGDVLPGFSLALAALFAPSAGGA